MRGDAVLGDKVLGDKEALALASRTDTARLAQEAAHCRDLGFGNVVTYSRKVFIPLTQLCRDVCHYCTFAQTPKHIPQAYMPIDEVIATCKAGAALGCQEALFTLGEKPELRYRAARESLAALGFKTTIDYVIEVARRVLVETGLLPHINAGNLTRDEMLALRDVSASMGIMLESASTRLCEKGMPHYGSPDKDPITRLATLDLAGELRVPFTSGILIGIGETRLERIESLLALRTSHRRYGHLQEVIVQNFRAKPHTKMALAPEPDLEELVWTIAVARLIFGAEMSIQAPPNLSPGVLEQLVAAGINDWGGVSPLTPDHVNPEAPWPHLAQLARDTGSAGKYLDQRLTLYPRYLVEADTWLSPKVQPAARKQSDGEGYAKRDEWIAGISEHAPSTELSLPFAQAKPAVAALIERCLAGEPLAETEIATLLRSRGADFGAVIEAADTLRKKVSGDTVSYVVNRNINYTNVCYFKCQFCAFSKGSGSENLRGKPYDISAEEITRRCVEAWERGATEVCMQGGIHPDYTGQTYLDIIATVRKATPAMHIHAFSPLEVWQGAETLNVPLTEFLARLKSAGLDTLPGTAAEILHDDVRAHLCPDKLNSAQWLEVMESAHAIGFRTTATIMFGHIESPEHSARHLYSIAELQRRTGGFTEFVPLPFVAHEAPMYKKGKARRGPSYREALLMHAVPRLVFNGLIDNIQASWVKMGREGVAACLNAGANDVGGSLMNESITRAAGAEHGEEWSPAEIETTIRALGREPRMRSTLYADAPAERRDRAQLAAGLAPIHLDPAARTQRTKLGQQSSADT
ncbi:MAG: 2-phospho-L-lactate guanylyltransferase [OM182 bacterium BACL3 MAG-120619-bin3]|uniref:FO synthase n=1 Tax=OM182 bacterium BACL3 MAG-120619-bin3 TaxID=1655593 RepID=A0A0R2TIY0_9GAMM|nr:MAG: 2-phospho-L-lactate guanylyltransferase [OM182 bacterium BACL3 MAG-120619-bin3]